jgi:tetratricopeptide (TPR) repeat protein
LTRKGKRSPRKSGMNRLCQAFFHIKAFSGTSRLDATRDVPCGKTSLALSRGSLFPSVLILLCPLAALSGPSDNSYSPGEVTVLEPVFVEASSGNPWFYFSVPGFEVISHCPEGFNETYARALQISTAARLAVLPASFWGDMPTPMKIVLYNREPEAHGAFGGGNPIDLKWSSADGRSVGMGSIQHSHPVTVGDGDTFINCGNYWNVQASIDNFSVDPDSDMRIRNRVPEFPTWFLEGMEGQYGLYPNRIIQSAMFTCTLVLPSATWISYSETEAVQNEAKERHKDGKAHRWEMLPLADVFSGSVAADKRDLGNSEGALFVRWGLYGSGNRRGFLDFVDRASREPVTEQLFRRCLGIGYDEALMRLNDYLPKAVSGPISVPIAVPEKTPDLREASSVEVARIIGDWGRLEGRSLGTASFDNGSLAMGNFQYQRDCLDQADRLFERVYRRGNTDPLFLAAFGLYELQVGDNVRARDALERATKAGVPRPRAYVDLARMRLDESLPSVQGGIGDLSEEDFSEITDLLTTARVQMPSLLATYDILARVLEHAPKKPDREHIRPLEEAMELFPRNASLAYKLANLYGDLGLTEQATAVINRATRFSDSDQSRALLAEFLAKKAR